MPKNIDLHIHSTASDGRLSPKELIDLAIKMKIPAIAITDHNTASGNKEAIEYSKGKKIEFVPGIEITITPSDNCKEIHMVGLFIDSNNKGILDIPKRHRVYAEKTTKQIIEKLNKLGYKISFEEFLKETAGRHLGRPFIARILMKKYPEEFKERQEVFDRLLGQNGEAFVRPIGTHMKKAIDIIHNAGGIAILAHPWFLKEDMESTIRKFSNLGGDGVELDYIPRDEIQMSMKKSLLRIIREKKLVISGGTDFHEFEKKIESKSYDLNKISNEIGDKGITQAQFKKLKRYWREKNNITTPILTDKITWRGHDFIMKIFNSTDFYKLNRISQVSGFIFNNKNEMLIVKCSNKDEWALPGGGPEKQDKDWKDTLIREVIEETDVELKNITPVCYIKTISLDKNFHHPRVGGDSIRAVARVKKINKQTIDPANGRINQRRFIPIKDFLKYCHWGKNGKLQLELALKAMKKTEK